MEHKAIILSAGIGSRIKEYTTKIPKCLIPIDSYGGKTTILSHQINVLIKLNIVNIVVVVGVEGTCWNKEIISKVRRIWPNVIENNYNVSKTKNQSIFVGLKHLDNGPTFIIDGDIIFNKTIINDLLGEDDNTITVCQSDKNHDNVKAIVKEENGFAKNIEHGKVKVKSLFYNGITNIKYHDFSIFKKLVFETQNNDLSYSQVLSLFLQQNRILKVKVENSIINVNKLSDLDALNLRG